MTELKEFRLIGLALETRTTNENSSQQLITRAYKADFEVYSEKSKDWNNAEVDIYISI